MEDEIAVYIEEAMNEVIGDMHLLEGARVTDVLPHPDADRYSIHIRKGDGQYLFLHISPAEALTESGGDDFKVAAFKKQIYRELKTHFPDL